MKILITNTVALNGGDAAILEGVLNLLRSLFGEDTEFIIYDNQSEVASKYYPSLNFQKSLYQQLKRPTKSKRLAPVFNLINFLNKVRFYVGLWAWTHNFRLITKLIASEEELKSIDDYSSADLIVSTGGTYLVENYSLDARIFDYKVSLAMKKPLIFFTQSLGPFSISKNRHALRQIFEQSLLILLRDYKSQNHILELGVQKARTHVTSDAAFALADLNALEKAQAITHLPSPPQIAISVRDWKHFKAIDPHVGRKNYLKALQDLTIHLIEKYHAKVTYVSTCQGIAEYWTDDSKFAQEIVDGLPNSIKDAVNVDRNFHSPQTLIQLVKDYDVVIATRLHMAILSLGAGVPVFPIAYEFKTQELFKKLGCGHWTVDIEEIESQSLIQSVDSFLNSIPETCKTLFPAVKQEREQAWESSSLVKNFFEEWQRIHNC
jgi:colanic acid/amylovoran biosynthesis protein